jgi:mono/diheme cytochrome c family protein
MKSHGPLLLATLLGLASACPALAAPPAAQCPQPRFTGKAPDDYYNRTNPLAPGAQDSAAARRIFVGRGNAISCATCHGEKGDGRGEMSDQFNPRPRNFTCAQTIDGVPDGQLFWIIRFGSPGTSMPPHGELSDEQVWQMVAYLRHLAK